jgi:hypothetical protein
MKNKLSAASSAALLLAGALASSSYAQVDTDLTIPVGDLNASPTIVRTGTHPTLTWAINYPSKVISDGGFVTSTSTSGSAGNGNQYSSTLTPTVNVDAEIRIVGSGVRTSGNSSNSSWIPTEGRVKYDDGSYQVVFFNTNDRINPNKVVWRGHLTAGKKLRFGGRFRQNNKWSNAYTSESGTGHVVTLVNGQTPPTRYPLHTSPALISFMSPYLDSTGKIKIGPMDVLVMVELTNSGVNTFDPDWDYQDLVMLVSFKTKSNNGHGNNIDGVDSSNPGKAPFVDSDPTVDDEKK